MTKGERRTLWAWILIGGPLAVLTLWGLVDNARLFLITLLNGLTLGALYFIVASGFTLVFGLMRNVNLAHGSLYLLGGYIGFIVAEKTGWWVLAIAAGFAAAALGGLLLVLMTLALLGLPATGRLIWFQLAHGVPPSRSNHPDSTVWACEGS